MPTNIHFTGSVASGNNIIAYGDYGAYMLTTDKGISWKQYSLHEFGVIQDMVNQNDTLWGIIDEGYIVRSLDNGINWSKHKFDLDSADHFVKIVVNENYVFVQSVKGIHRFDKNNNFINSITDSLLVVRYSGFGYVPGVKPFNYSGNEIFTYKNQIILGSKSYYNGFLLLPENLSKIDTVNLQKNVFPFWSNQPHVYHLRNIFKYKGNNVFNINNNLYYSDDNFTKWTYFYPDTTYLNNSDSLFFKKWRYPDFMTQTYYFSNDNLFMNHYLNDNGKIMYPSSIGYLGGGTLGKFGIKKYVFEGDSCDFRLYNNYFDNKYYTPKYSDFVDSPIASVYTSRNTLLDDNNIVKVGKFKTILQTLNDCKSWELVSSLNAKPKIILNDSTYIFINDAPNTNDTYRTNNYGNTFMPTELGLDTSLTVILHKDSLGNIDTLSKTIDTVTHFGRFSKTSIFYFDTSGRSFWGGPLSFISNYNYNFAYSQDSGRRYKFGYLKDLILGASYWEPYSSNIELIDGKYIFSISNPARKWKDMYYNYTYLIDSNFNPIISSKFDSMYIVHHILADDLKNYIVFTNSQDKNDLFKFRFEIKETNDGGKTFTTINSIDKQLTIDQIYEHNKDSVFFSTFYPANLYLYDRKRNVIDTLYKRGYDDSVKVMYLSGKWYLVGNNLFLENTDRNDLTKWTESPWDFGRPSFESVIFKGNVAIAKLSDSLRQTNYYRIMPKIETKVNEEKVEIEYYNNHFYASAPFPLPAETVVKTKISWDMSFDLVDAVKGVYNIYGEKIENKENIQINIFGKASAELVWNCVNIPSGLYFILVYHNGISDCIPIIIGK
jgi:hypothetical protein